MKISTYSHNLQDSIKHPQIVTALSGDLEVMDFKFERNAATELREKILTILMNRGWSKPIQISDQARISITSIKGRTGLCLQTGNMARFYADFLKLEYLFKNGTIDFGVYCTLTKKSAARMGSNLANYERIVNELGLFSKIITMPIIVVGIGQT